MKTKGLLAVIVAFSATTTLAFAYNDGPPPGFFPPNMPNVGELYVEQCFVGNNGCFDTRVKAWGQVCDSTVANAAVNGPSDEADHVSIVPPMHYTGWRCGQSGELISPDKVGYYNDGAFREVKP